ncbi:hypothetical protein [Sphingobacterium yanglingense]|nr:hypothetical protein [Sphingobacterium yanglingense]
MDKKVTIKDLEVKKGKVDVEFIEVDGKQIILTHIPYGNIDHYVTHTNCRSCKVEFKKNFNYSHTCESCLDKSNREKYLKKPVVTAPYDGIIYDEYTDKYFTCIEEVIEHYEEDEISLDNAMLLTTVSSSYASIDIEQISQDVVHEDWDPSDELLEKIEEFNKFLETESTGTVFPTDERIDISQYLSDLKGDK